MIRWGVLSAGRITHTFARDMLFCQGACIHAVAARNGKKARDFAYQYNIPHAYEGYQALLDDPAIDVIYIASPHTLHAEHAAAALKAGKHVLCEKPVTVTEEELTMLIGLAKANQCFFMEAMWTYFLPAIQQAKTWVEQGEIGELLSVRADFGYPVEFHENKREYDASLAGGCALEVGIYPIALNRLFHHDVASEKWKTQHLAPNGVEDDVLWTERYASSTAVLHTSFRAKLPNSAYLIGTKGTIEIPDFFRAQQCTLYEVETPRLTFEEPRDSFGFNYQIEHVGEAILRGDIESDICSWEKSLCFQRDLAYIRAMKPR